VRGRGFLPVTTDVEVNLGASDSTLLLATTGSFRPDENGYLRTSSGLILMGWPANPDGTMPTFPRDTRVGLEPIRMNTNQFIGEPTTEMNLVMNLPATDTEAGSSGDPHVLSMEYFDNLGKSARLSASFTPVVPATGESNQWNVTLTDGASGGAVVGQYTLTFDDSRGGGGTLLSVTNTTGGVYNPTTGAFTINVAGGPIDVRLGELGAPDGITQLSNAFAPVNITKNGSPAGNLTSVEIDPNGFVHASYDVGISRIIFQVPLVDVPNQNGLESFDNETYGITPDSGSFFLWDAGDGPTGDVVAYAQEESSTDVAGELTSLIQTQRAYSSNAKVIQTVDEMLQETTNIKR
jgi:flagellar hook protein FlgE